MNRRQALATLSTAIAAVSGCVSQDTELEENDQTDTGNESDAPSETELSEESSGVSDENRHDVYQTEDLQEYTVSSWVWKESLRVYNSVSDDLTDIRPRSGDIFLQVGVRIINNSGESRQRVLWDGLQITDGDELYSPIESLPHGYEWDDLRQRDGRRILDPWVNTNLDVDPGSDQRLYPIFSPDLDSFEPDEWSINISRMVGEDDVHLSLPE